MKIIPLPFETQARLGFNTKIILTAADLATWTSGTAQAVLPGNGLGLSSSTIPAGTRMSGNALVRVTTAFTSSGGAITSLGLSLGDGNSATRFINAADLKTTGYKVGTETGLLYLVADTIDATATIVGQTMASLNAGQVEILCNLVPVSDLEAVV